jgi:hypothetical protein
LLSAYQFILPFPDLAARLAIWDIQMPKIQSKYIKLKSLSVRSEAVKIVRLIMAFNDMVLANKSAPAYEGDLRPTEVADVASI